MITEYDVTINFRSDNRQQERIKGAHGCTPIAGFLVIQRDTWTWSYNLADIVDYQVWTRAAEVETPPGQPGEEPGPG